MDEQASTPVTTETSGEKYRYLISWATNGGRIIDTSDLTMDSPYTYSRRDEIREAVCKHCGYSDIVILAFSEYAEEDES